MSYMRLCKNCVDEPHNNLGVAKCLIYGCHYKKKWWKFWIK